MLPCGDISVKKCCVVFIILKYDQGFKVIYFPFLVNFHNERGHFMLLCDLGNFLKSVAVTGQAENRDPKYKVKHL